MFFKGRVPLGAVKGAIKTNKTLLSIDLKHKSSVGSACQKGLRDFARRGCQVEKNTTSEESVHNNGFDTNLYMNVTVVFCVCE